MPFDFSKALSGAGEGASLGPVGSAIGLAAGLIPQLFGLGAAAKQRKAAEAMQAQADAQNQQAMNFANQGLSYAKSNLATAQNAYNGRMAGASYLEGNINANQGNTLAALGRNSTSAAQQLALAGDIQGNTNNAFNSLAQNEAQNKMYQGQNLSYANMGIQGSLSNIQGLNSQQGMMKQQAANQLGNASQVNKQNAINGIGNLGILAAQGFSQGDDGNQLQGQSGGISSDNFQMQQFNPQPQMVLPGLGYNIFHR